MRTFALLLLFAAGCGSEPSKEETDPDKERAKLYAPAEGVSAAKDLTFLDKYSGQVVTLHGVFQHEHFQTGVVVLESGLRIRIPHFDHFSTGDDWLKYVGHRCAATGILHTWTKNLPDYHSATLEIQDFSGSTSE
jgi:hypothetical protein